ncbi:MAG: hypothetical protein ABEJ40_04445 [Haloarculaceae archaeon]
MPDCDYCGDSFDGEAAYLDHLALEHGEDLGPIDRRRVERAADEADDAGTGLALGPAVLGGLLALAAGLVVYVTFLGSDGSAAFDRDAPATSSSTR